MRKSNKFKQLIVCLILKVFIINGFLTKTKNKKSETVMEQVLDFKMIQLNLNRTFFVTGDSAHSF